MLSEMGKDRSMTEKADFYRGEALAAKARAAEPNNDAFTRTLWLLVAEDWLRMIPKAERH
jgi:hypothetical protein